MAIEVGPRFTSEDVFIDYPFEEVMFRWNHLTRKIYKRFYGENEQPQPVPHDNRLFNDALLYGNEITQKKYQLGENSRE